MIIKRKYILAGYENVWAESFQKFNLLHDWFYK